MIVVVLLGLLLGLLLVFLLAEVVHRMRQGLAPQTYAPSGESFSAPALCHWTALDDQQLERFVRDSSP